MQLDNLSGLCYILLMEKAMAVGELKARFSAVLDEVSHGQKVDILYGRAKKPVATIIPYQEEPKGERKIGILDGIAKIEVREDFEMTPEELVDL